VVVLAVMAFILATLAGWLTLGYEVGKQMASSIFKTSWHPVLTAVIGNLTLYILARGLWMIPCLGWTIVVLVALIGLGMAVVTLFGTNPYPRTAASAKPEQEVLTFDEVNDDDQENDEA
jgi:hypothetical protein